MQKLWKIVFKLTVNVKSEEMDIIASKVIERAEVYRIIASLFVNMSL